MSELPGFDSVAVHKNTDGARLAIKHLREYLHQFPDDLSIRWLLNLTHMTLGEYLKQVDRQFFVELDRFVHSEFDIGKFRIVEKLYHAVLAFAQDQPQYDDITATVIKVGRSA